MMYIQVYGCRLHTFILDYLGVYHVHESCERERERSWNHADGRDTM